MNISQKSHHLLTRFIHLGLALFLCGLACPLGRAQSDEPAAASVAASPTQNMMINASAASYANGGEVAQESIVAGFGADLATEVVLAQSVPLPTELAGVRISVRDEQGVDRFAPLFFVSPNQINYQIPPGTAIGTVSMTVTRNNTRVAIGSARVLRVAPGLFAANANGQGVPSALALRIRADNSLSYEPVAQYDAGQGRWVPLPIDLGPATDQVFLVAYGTGMKFNGGVNLFRAQMGGTSSEVLYAGAAPGFAGLDQINLRIPRSLAGRGEVELTLLAETRTANPLRITIQ